MRKIKFVFLIVFIISLNGGTVLGQSWDRAMEMYYSGDYPEAFKQLKRLADQGGATAQQWVGSMYYSGDGVGRNYKKAAEYYLLSANQGNEWAQHQLGKMYEEGEGVPRDKEKAFELYTLSARKCHPYGHYSLGVLYQKSKDFDQAYLQFRLSAAQAEPSHKSIEYWYQTLKVAAEKKLQEVKKQLTSRKIERAEDVAQDWAERVCRIKLE